MKIQIKDWQGKTGTLTSSLIKEGVTIVQENADALLIDFDANVSPYPAIIEKAHGEGAKILVYSHGAFSMIAWDGIHLVGNRTSAYLALSRGQKLVMETYKYPRPIHVTGWHYCEQLPFRETSGTKVLFAPWHPHGWGYLRADAKRLNADVFETLLHLNKPISLAVRYIGHIEANGLRFVNNVGYEQSDTMLASTIRTIDASDIVVTNPGTLSALAVARGKPVVMYGQDLVPAEAYSEQNFVKAKTWDKYKEIMRYPYSIDGLNYKDATSLLEKSITAEATGWRNLWVGDDLDSKNLVAVIQKYTGKG